LEIATQDFKVSVDLSVEEPVTGPDELGNTVGNAPFAVGRKQFASLEDLTILLRPLLQERCGRASRLIVFGGGGTNVIFGCNLPSALSMYLKFDASKPFIK
jgi:hypothetical protein